MKRQLRAGCSQMTWVPIPTLSYTSCVTFSISLTLSVPQFSHLLAAAMWGKHIESTGAADGRGMIHSADRQRHGPGGHGQGLQQSLLTLLCLSLLSCLRAFPSHSTCILCLLLVINSGVTAMMESGSRPAGLGFRLQGKKMNTPSGTGRLTK